MGLFDNGMNTDAAISFQDNGRKLALYRYGADPRDLPLLRGSRITDPARAGGLVIIRRVIGHSPDDVILVVVPVLVGSNPMMRSQCLHHRLIPFPDISDSLGHNLRDMLLHIIPCKYILPGEGCSSMCALSPVSCVLIFLPGGGSIFARGSVCVSGTFCKKLKPVIH